MIDWNDQIGQYIKAVRTTRGMSRNDVCQRTGWQMTTVARIENGQQKIKVADLPELGKALGVRFSDVIAALEEGGPIVPGTGVNDDTPDDPAVHVLIAGVLYVPANKV